MPVFLRMCTLSEPSDALMLGVSCFRSVFILRASLSMCKVFCRCVLAYLTCLERGPVQNATLDVSCYL